MEIGISETRLVEGCYLHKDLHVVLRKKLIDPPLNGG